MGRYSGMGIDDGRLSGYHDSTCFYMDGLDEMLNELPDFDEFCEEALKEAAPIMEKEMKKYCSDAIIHDGDSELVESIKAQKPKKTNTDGWIVSIGPTGNSKKVGYYKTKGRIRKYPVSNALKAIWKEYGIPGQQEARPFLTAATNAARSAVVAKLQEVYNRMVSG